MIRGYRPRLLVSCSPERIKAAPELLNSCEKKNVS